MSRLADDDGASFRRYDVSASVSMHSVSLLTAHLWRSSSLVRFDFFACCFVRSFVLHSGRLMRGALAV
jgi:hypothetical protein